MATTDKLLGKTKIIYQDDNLLVINKPAGLLVHSSAYQKTSEPTLVDWLLKNFPQVKNVGDDTEFRPGIVHRLDKDTSGIMLVPLNRGYFSYLKKLFQDKKVKKEYLTVVSGAIKEKNGRIEKPIGIKSGTTKRSIHSGKMAKEAVTEYELVRVFKKDGQDFSLLKVFPLTGRTHQIRVHLASINHPVIGDPLYGGKKNAYLAPRLMLHASSVEFRNEKNSLIHIEAPLPEDLNKVQ